jgi:riboflavin kinase/FMN adenylyltransferase
MTVLADDVATTEPADRRSDRVQRAAGARIPVWHGTASLPTHRGRCVAALGDFDGVHRGHARLLEHAVAIGRRRGLPVVMVTFDPHPARVVGVPRDTSTLSSLAQRAGWAAEVGVSAVLVLPFTRALAASTPDEFVREILDDALHVDAVVVGADFTFGARAAGTAETLAALGPDHGFTAHPVELLPVTDTACSSTHIRGCLRRGDVTGAARALGRPHQVDTRADGEVLTVDDHTALPAPGRYRARVATEPVTSGPVALDEADGLVTVDEHRRLHPHPGPALRADTRVLVSFLARSRR